MPVFRQSSACVILLSPITRDSLMRIMCVTPSLVDYYIFRYHGSFWENGTYVGTVELSGEFQVSFWEQ